ncbi:MAG: hypothetical protein JNK87_09650 [Bryobacterales bacterium]|nr:hypothetical protein [Bryobacterales bacterium]
MSGSVEPLKKLHGEWKDRVHFVDVLIRQAHPGPGAPPYTSVEEKMADGERHKREDGVPYPVLVDDLDGTTHQVYGGMADPTYVIDAEGRVAFYNMWTHAPTLHRALEKLLAQDGVGVVEDGYDRVPHLLPSMADGWVALRRGAPQSVIDMERAVPGSGVGTWLGHQVRPLLAPLALRAKPVPVWVRMGLAFGLGFGVMLGARRCYTLQSGSRGTETAAHR